MINIHILNKLIAVILLFLPSEKSM